MAIHVAILKRPYLRMMLDGRKTVESRLTKTAQPPFGMIRMGERIFFKESGGPFMATAIAGDIEFHDGLTREKLRQLYRRFNHAVCGEDAYWRAKADVQYAAFIHLERVEPLDVGPRYARSAYKAWFVVDEALSPLREVVLTAGAIRNRYATMPKPAFSGSRAAARSRGCERAAAPHPLNNGLSFILPDGRVIHTDLARGRMIRWRGWGSYYERHRVRPGDVMRFVAVGPNQYRVSFNVSGAD